MTVTANWTGAIPTTEQHVALMRLHAKQLRDQADRYDVAIAAIEGAGQIPTPSTAPSRAIPSTKRIVKAPISTVRRSGGKAVGEELERYRKVVEAKGLSVAADELGVGYNTLYYQAKRGGWKLPKSAPRAVKVAAKEATGALRRCDRCEQMTRSDPCQHCGHNWIRGK
jgi:hypothetical protein